MTAVITDWLPYCDRLAQREPAAIRRVVIHCTELPDLAMAREYAERIHHRDSRTGNSGHFYIDRDGSVHQWVPLERVAHHVRDHNADSVGMELVNRGRYPDWFDSRHQAMREPYPPDQIDALIALLADLNTHLPGPLELVGHEDLDTAQVPASDDPARTVSRKRDPGPQFPWDRVVTASGLTRLR